MISGIQRKIASNVVLCSVAIFFAILGYNNKALAAPVANQDQVIARVHPAEREIEVLVNDVGTNPTIIGVTGTTFKGGTAVIIDGGTKIKYTPPVGFVSDPPDSDLDYIEYTIQDPTGTDTALVIISVNYDVATGVILTNYNPNNKIVHPGERVEIVESYYVGYDLAAWPWVTLNHRTRGHSHGSGCKMIV